MGDAPKNKSAPSKAREQFLALMAIVIVGGVLFGMVKWREYAGRQAQTDLGTVYYSSNMKITSQAFEQDGQIPSEYTCDGADMSPPLEFSGVPEEAKSLVLIVDDPDAPMGTWVHWTLWNIPSDASGIEAGSVPAGAVEGATSFGKPGYGGPCPPSGEHRYFFKLYALDSELDLPAAADADGLESAMDGHIIDKAGLVGLYSRQK